MHYIVACILVVFVLVANSSAVSVSPPLGGDVNRYCQLKRRISPKISGVDLVVSVMLNSGEMISISPDAEGLSGYYKFSDKDKDACVAAFLNGTNTAGCCESLRLKIKGVLENKIPENCAVAMTRLGLEEEFNRQHAERFHVCSHGKRLVSTNDHLEVSFALSKTSKTFDIIEDLPLRVDAGGIGEVGGDNGVVMLRGKNYFQIAEKSLLTHMSVVYFSSGAIRVNVVLSGIATSGFSEVAELLCYIPQIGVYGMSIWNR